MGEITQKRNKDTDSDIVDLIQKVNIKKSMLENYLRDKSKFITEKPMLSWAMQVQSTFELYLKKYTLLRVLLSILNHVKTICSPDSDSDTEQYVSSYMELYVLKRCCGFLMQSFPKFSYQEIHYVADFPVTMSNFVFGYTKTGRLVMESNSLIVGRMHHIKSEISRHVTENNLSQLIDEGFKMITLSIASSLNQSVLSMTALKCLENIYSDESLKEQFQCLYLSKPLLSFYQNNNLNPPYLRVIGHDCKNADRSDYHALQPSNISISRDFFSELFKPSTEKTAEGEVVAAGGEIIELPSR